MKHRIHMTLQGKGGVGKSLVAFLLAQYYQSKDWPVTNIDADPINATLTRYESFHAEGYKYVQNNEVDFGLLDELMEYILTLDNDAIIDNGAASFVPMSNSLMNFGAVELFEEYNKELYIHTVVTGGQGILDTLEGLSRLCQSLPEYVKIVVWLNEYWGEVEIDGKSFEKLKIYDELKSRITGVIKIPQQRSLFANNFRAMMDNWQTFDEALKSHNFRILEKQRLTMIRRVLFEQIEPVLEADEKATLTEKVPVIAK